jgi:hypothetical protein
MIMRASIAKICVYRAKATVRIVYKINWTIRNVGGLNFSDVVDNGSLLVAVGDQGLVATSIDGINWIFPPTGIPTTGFSLTCVIWDSVNSRFITCCSTTSYPLSFTFYTSTNGSTWVQTGDTISNLGTGQIVAYDAGFYIGGINTVDWGKPNFYYSTGLTGWTTCTSIGSFSTNFSTLRFNVVNGQLFCAGAWITCGVYSAIFVRTALQTFQQETGPNIYAELRDIVPQILATDYFCSMGTSYPGTTENTIAHSSDVGATWSQVSVSGLVTPTHETIYTMCYHSGLFVAFTLDSQYSPSIYRIYTSSDGLAWTHVFG